MGLYHINEKVRAWLESLLKGVAIDGARQVFELFGKEYDIVDILRYD